MRPAEALDADLPVITSAAVLVEVIHPEIDAAAPKWTLPRPAVEPVPQAVAQSAAASPATPWHENWMIKHLARMWHATTERIRTAKRPGSNDLGLLRGAGDENRTRALSLGSDGAWACFAGLTCGRALGGSGVVLGGRNPVDRGYPL
ncbi:hypothetical protein ACH4NS_07650 [Streptomyces mutabilis]|uniref:hypothetical protein n=1 Tax=Streptomyces mutabilis TaxID=67332 RepID=UPI003796D847